MESLKHVKPRMEIDTKKFEIGKAFMIFNMKTGERPYGLVWEINKNYIEFMTVAENDDMIIFRWLFGLYFKLPIRITVEELQDEAYKIFPLSVDRGIKEDDV